MRTLAFSRDALVSMLANALFMNAAFGQGLSWRHSGENTGDLAGWTIVQSGDVDGDGRADVLASVPGSDCNGSDAGLVIVLRGTDGSEAGTACGMAGILFGHCLDGRLDIDSDGHADFLVGAPADSRNGAIAGAFIIYSGATGGVLRDVLGPAARQQLGTAVTSIGDLDADGVRDYLVGADSTTPGTEFVVAYSGVSGAVLFTLLPSPGSRSFGSAVADAGDVDGDLICDILVADPNGDGATIADSGRVYVFSGADGSLLHDLEGEHDDSRFGSSVDGIGDVDLDGFADFVIGARDYTKALFHYGKVYVYSGKDGTLLFSNLGGDTDSLGWAVSGAGDVNHDGYVDYLASDPSGAGSPGSVHLFSGRNGEQLYHWVGDSLDNTIGFAIDGDVDLDGDGRLEVIFGMQEDDTNGKDAGAVAVYSLEDFYLDASPKRGIPGIDLSLTMSQTAPGNLIGLAVTAIDGSPFFAFLAIAPADGLGAFNVTGQVPLGVGGHDVDFQAYAIGFDGKLVASIVENIEFL